MLVLLGTRFLKWFAGDLKNRQKQLAIILKDQNPEAEVEMTVSPDSPAFEEDCADRLSIGNHLPNEDEQNKKNDTETHNE